MSRSLARMIRALTVVALLGLLVSTSLAQEAARLRFVHVIPETVSLDVFVNGNLAVKRLDYGEASAYINVQPGATVVTVTPTGLSTTLWEQTFDLEAASFTNLVASSGDNPRFDRVTDNLSPTSLGTSRLLFFHALEGGPNVAVALASAVDFGSQTQEAGSIIAPDLAYGLSFGAFDLPAQSYNFDIITADGGTPVIPGVELPLASGVSNIAIVYGTQDNPQALLITEATSASQSVGFLRFANATNQTIDILVNDTLVVPNLSIDRPTEHIAIPVGLVTVTARGANADTVAGTVSVDVAQNRAETIILLPDGNAQSLERFTDADDITTIAANEVLSRVLNGVPGTQATISLQDGTALGANVPFGTASEAVTLAPSSSSTRLTLTVAGTTGEIEGPNLTFYGGNLYTTFVLQGDAFAPTRILVIPTTISQTVASTPGNETIAIAAQPTPIAVQSTPAPVQATAPQGVVQPTAVPTAAILTTSTDENVTATVALDASANLQLRQLPSRDALSLGLAPANSRLIVNGREGTPVALVEGEPAPPEAEDFVDPVTQLTGNDDLDPAETWLNVTYETPDGGTITAWTLAQFLVVREPDGDLERLADLPTIGRNVPGQAENTDITPPPPPTDRVTATVIGLNPGVNLNLRRTPSTAGEVLTRLQLGTEVELLGFLDDEETPPAEADWAFIEFRPAAGGVITGWAGTLFLEYERNDADITADELLTRELVDTFTEETIGEIAGGATQAEVPTPDPLEDAFVAEVILDPGANLQFRRSPDRNSESLGLIPAGTQVIVSGRTLEGDWLQVTFEGQSGWIAAQFVAVTFNGDFVEVTSIPVIVTDTDEGEDDTTDNGQ